MTALDQLRQMASALPSDSSAVTLTRLDLMAMLNEESGPSTVTVMSDLTVPEVAREVNRAESTVRGWLTSGVLRVHKFGREWRIARSALREFLDAQATNGSDLPHEVAEVDITTWRRVRGA